MACTAAVGTQLSTAYDTMPRLESNLDTVLSDLKEIKEILSFGGGVSFYGAATGNAAPLTGEGSSLGKIARAFQA